MKKVIFHFFTVLLTLFYIFLFSGLMGLMGEHGIGKDGNAHIIHHLGAGLVIALIATGLASQLLKYGDRIAGFQQVLALMLGIVVMAFIVGDPDNYGGNKAIFDLAFLIIIIPILLLWLIHPNRKRMLVLDIKHASKPLLATFSVLLIPLFVYGVQQSLAQRNSYPPLSDIHHSHWHAMGTLAFSTIFIGLVGAMRTKGYLLPLGIASSSLVLLGIISIFYPTAASSLGSSLGLATLSGGLVSGWLTFKDYANSRTA